ncbi:MAG TPA: TonB-dependent receptor [Prolixibacteraceae bacterium]|jgi:TonB-linked SusC/RagA family outer membrane protein
MKKTIFLTLIILLVSLLSLQAQQSGKVSGKVVDLKTGEELIGVRIMINGSAKGTTTDINGNYTLEVPNLSNDQLSFSYIGYEALHEPIKGRNTINVKLNTADQQLGEVVVVGYGVQKKESVIGSISSISNKTLVSVPVSNISQALSGKLSGIQVVQSSGEIGGDVADIYVRGRATWNNATPLFVVDGIVRAEFAKIDPNEIETINILKDASATAVYGVKGANGVIIITTKRGALGKPKISVTAQTAITEPINIPEPLGAYDAMSLRYLADWGQYTPRTPQTKGGTNAYDLLLWRTGASPWTHPDVRWMDNVLKKQSTQQQYNINISGGTKTVRYFVSGGVINQNGFYQNDDLTKYSRFNFRSNLDVDVSKNLTASLSIGARVENLNSPNNTIWSSWDIYRAAFANSGRMYPIYNPDGSYAGTGNNIVRKLNEAAIYKDVTSTLESSLSLNYKLDFITKGLSVKGQVSFDTQGETGRSWTNSTAEYVYDQTSNSYQMFGEDRPLSYAGVQKNNNWYKSYLEAGLNYNRSFGENSITALILANRNELVRNAEVPFADQGLVGRVTYDYNKRYFGEFNVGYNGSENFPNGSKYGLFPAFALGWMVSNEKFIANTQLSNIISTLKLRASLGWVGNDQYSINNVPQRFLYLQEFSNAGGYTFGTGDNYFGGIQQGAIANQNATWEVARKANLGIETEFLKGLFGINVDYFYEYRNKILTNIDAVKPEYVGAAFNVANIGETENKGFEIELKHNLRINKNFSYFVKGNFTYNRNKILKKADPLGLLPYQKEEGYPIGTPLMWNNTGYFTSYEEINASPTQLGNNNGIPGDIEIIPGDLKFEDFNHDGVINQADAYRQGYGTVPEMQYGITLGGNWKAFDFSVLFQGSTHALFMKQWEIMWAFSNNDNVFDKHDYYWAPEIADAAQFTRFYGKSWINNERYYSTYEAGSGTYIRLKNVELGYTLPMSLIQKAKMTGVRIYLSAVNPYMWSVEKYLDPDNRDTRGGRMPATRAFNIGLNVNF